MTRDEERSHRVKVTVEAITDITDENPLELRQVGGRSPGGPRE
jgi:hypothetical protein